ncbi:NAD(P)/FAD-dependent oxidoreductase [Paraflavitalea sp. CAU 1676]|uniref:NAD(P)/FAD-dependent oxidoreductase n=1 Tax=Paraflavitalea sp. CAU 1676 TaxID=3032598 RepID=UPI0023DAF434|nr:NAD(P)/FAD-dependent oxidoreductase [Paraflavitalea sp. CAU 1676]MDF2191755.1 NAD(P)/FAD-dependent oxidoreductase [Paraflavitalea sp. CAU 1676]
MAGNKKRLVVVGGGAAGFFCAVNAARMHPGLEVIIVEKTNKVLSKVRVSGGGRCNVTHACFSIADMVRRYPRGTNFLKKSFHHFFTTNTIEWFKERGVALKTEEDGRMFPVTDSSQTIIDCLMREVNKYGIEVWMSAEVQRIQQHEGRFQLTFASGKELTADYACIACGGYPKTVMFDWLKTSGHSIEEPVPSLFTFNMPGNPITQLMGVSVPSVQIKITGSKLSAEGPVLITHWGLSGPAVLRLSAWGARDLAAGHYSFSIVLNWLPDYNENSMREHLQALRFELAAQKISNRNPFGLPQRLWDYLLEQSGINGDIRWADVPAKEQNKLVKQLCAQEFAVKGKTTFKDEFVTAGGIRLAEVDANTMESKLLPGLYFAGEILDVDGITGGFNFQHAWTSGYLAAVSIARKEGAQT